MSIYEMPNEILHQIMDHLDRASLGMLSAVNKPLQEVIEDRKQVRPYIKHNIFSADKVMRTAAQLGYIRVIEFMQELGNELTHGCTTAAVSCGQLDTVQWLHSKGCPFLIDICNVAARKDHFDVLVYLHDIVGKAVCDAHYYAAQNNSVQTLEWLLTLDHTWNISTMCVFAAQSGSLDVLKWIKDKFKLIYVNDDVYNGAAAFGHIHVLEWLMKNNFPYNKATMLSSAVKSGDLTVIEYVYGLGGELNGLAYKEAVFRGRIPVLQWLVERGCPPYTESCHEAALYNKIDMLEHLGNNGLCTCKRYHSSANGHTQLVNRAKHRAK